MPRLSIKPATTVFLSILSVTLVVYVFRGLGLLTFIPGFLIWFLLFVTISAGVISRVQRTMR